MARAGHDQSRQNDSAGATAVSIHVARAGHDLGQPLHDLICLGEFQSTWPVRATTLVDWASRTAGKQFQSTWPVRATTAWRQCVTDDTRVSIHVARAGHDVYTVGTLPSASAFQSTWPVRATTPDRGLCRTPLKCFNPRGPCGPRPFMFQSILDWRCGFNPRGPCGPRPLPRSSGLCFCLVSIHVARAGHDRDGNI